jgi:hypothetical protein
MLEETALTALVTIVQLVNDLATSADLFTIPVMQMSAGWIRSAVVRDSRRRILFELSSRLPDVAVAEEIELWIPPPFC